VSARRELLLLAMVCLLTYGSGLGDVAFYTRGEPREGLVVREMLRSGAWAVPRRPEGEVARKPPLYYWLAAPIVRALPDAPELALRLPSAIVATGAVLITWSAARTVAGPAAGVPAALVLATSFEWMRAATSARVDMALAASLTLVLAAWLVMLAGGGRGWLPTAIAGACLATLAKGPVGLAVPVLAAAAFAVWRRDRTLAGRLGLVRVVGIGALVAGAWYLVAFAEQGRAFLDVVLKENVVRFIDTDDARTGHAHGLGYLPLLGLVGFLPWVPLLPLAVPVRRDDAPRTFAVVWATVVLVFFSLANAKRSVYLLPAFPALAIGIGAGIASDDRPIVRRLAAVYAPAVVALGMLALALAAGFDPSVVLVRWLREDDAYGARAVAAAARHAHALLVTLGCVTIAAGVVIERCRRAGALPALVVSVAILTAAWTAAFDTAIHPVISRTRSLRAFMTAVDRLVPPRAALHTAFPADPGLRFYAPRPLVPFELDGGTAPRWALVWEDEWRRLRDPNGAALTVLEVSEARQGRHGSLALVLTPAGALHRVRMPDGLRAEPGLRASPPR
jgi:4-amino-4-deoxy-L-arabinose transferase-like glycosyltransferase